MVEYIAYIDEAGDDGFIKLRQGAGASGQSRWLVLGCCLVTRETDLQLPAKRNAILARFQNRQSRDLHFRNLKHAQKTVVCQEIAALPIQAALTFSHKVTLPGSRWETTFAQKGYLYNYLLRWLLERLTTHCRQQAVGCSLRIIFSRRSGTDYAQMVKYLELMRDGREIIRPTRSIDWNVFDIKNITVENHSKWAGLQIADCVTSAFFSALEPNTYGNYETSYAELLRSKLIHKDQNILGIGLTLVPSIDKSQLDERQKKFIDGFRKK